MKWEYKLTTNTIWASFDYGEVEAGSEAEALIIAEEKLRYDLAKVNEALNHSNNTTDFSVEMDFTQIEVTLIESVKDKEKREIVEMMTHYYEVDLRNCQMTHKDWIEEVAKALTDPEYLREKNMEYSDYLESINA
jgi:hypothetical protein